MAMPTKAHQAVEEIKNGDIVPARHVEDYDGPLGSEGIDSEDIAIPRLKIGQAISDEVKEGLVKEGALFLNITGDALWEPGQPPLEVLIIAQSKEYVLWKPRQDGGGILARATPVRVNGAKRYKWDKPNEAFEVKVGGKIKVTWQTKEYIDEDGLGDWGSEIPDDKSSGTAATAHHNYLLLIPSQQIVVAVSMSRSGVKVAKDLNAQIKMGDISRVPLARRKFGLTTVDAVNDNGDKYKNWKFKAAGFLDKDSELAKLAMDAAKNFEQGFKVDLNEPSTSTAETVAPRNADMGGDDIPF